MYGTKNDLFFFFKVWSIFYATSLYGTGPQQFKGIIYLYGNSSPKHYPIGTIDKLHFHCWLYFYLPDWCIFLIFTIMYLWTSGGTVIKRIETYKEYSWWYHSMIGLFVYIGEMRCTVSYLVSLNFFQTTEGWWTVERWQTLECV